MLQLAQAVYAAEVEGKPAAQPAGPAAASAPGDAAAEPAEASYKLAVESLLTARAELEVRSAQRAAPPGARSPLTPPFLAAYA